jgi:predicted Fe-Mo cluster-binding NifX family protein
MERRVLITVTRDEVAPRFDLTTEVLLLSIAENGEVVSRKSCLMGHASGDGLCDLALSRDVGTIVCGGIEEEYYHYLRWKRIDVIDAVMGPVDRVIDRLAAGRLKAGDILFDRAGESA